MSDNRSSGCDFLYSRRSIIRDRNGNSSNKEEQTFYMSRLTLEKAEIDIDGEIASLVYSSADHYNKPGESFWKRVFR